MSVLVESQKDYHIKREQIFSTPAPTVPSTKMTTLEIKTTTSTFTIAQMTYMAYTEASFQTRENTERNDIIEIPIPTNMTFHHHHQQQPPTVTTNTPSKSSQRLSSTPMRRY